MSDTVNPYQSPEAEAAPVKPLAARGTLTETMLSYLKGASPWLRFIGILGFISSGLTAVWGLVSIALVPLMMRIWGQIPGFDSFSGVFGAAFGGSMVVLCVASAVLIFIPSLFIYRFGEKIRGYLRTGADQDLETALRNNKSFWKFCGIVSIIGLAFVPLLIIIGIVVGVAAAIF